MTGYTEQSFLENFVLFVPKGKARANVLMGVAVSANSILALSHQYGLWSEMEKEMYPTKGPGTGMLVGEGRPSITIVTNASMIHQKRETNE